MLTDNISSTPTVSLLKPQRGTQGTMASNEIPLPKVFKDPVHGEIELHPLCVKIIDTPEFQRLRYIKQLGGCCYLYHGATHTRFEHCIGVCHLAGKLVEAVTKRLEDESVVDKGLVSDKEKLCVKIAGLCHDLGHGPYSHMFENVVNEDRKKKGQVKWTHEDASKELVDRIYRNLDGDFKDYDLDEKDVEIIKELIHPPENHLKDVSEGDDEDKKKKFFLYEIVANETCGVDVDKWDYFARDALYLGVKNGFDHDRLISSARACYDDKGVRHVAYRDKDISTLYEMFHLRYSLHRIAYQHKVTKAADLMILDAMQKADDIVIKADDGNVKKISETPDDLGTYVNLNDNVIFKIKEQTGNAKAKEVVNRLLRRDLYEYLGKKIIGDEETEDDIVNQVLSENENEGESLRSHVGVFFASFDYGSKDKNPVLEAYFYGKKDMKKAVQKKEGEVSQMMLPKKFNEKVARVYCKSTDPEHVEKLRKMVNEWRK
ncbi:deoxynucleoside triphosphate triphosphohydrolase SAMHD1-like isoform X2 [Argopecten irradians]|uniref:deoxynucleoside triphosphate triphosphohydrolase SAMHD1-like isoform X2 n=2 Tax=Argopecten irradians TaxID=31199 RepID=UPI0037231172